MHPALTDTCMERNERVFVDTNYFVALFNSSDALHREALRVAKEIDAAGARLVISNFIFLETMTVLAQKRGKETAREAGNYLLAGGGIEMIHIDEVLQRSSWEIFRELREKNVSFVDASIIAILKAEDISRLMTFDCEDFKKLARRYSFGIYAE